MQIATKKAAVVNLATTLFFTFLFSLFITSPVQAQWIGDCIGQTNFGYQDVPTIKGLECAFASVISFILPLAGVILFVMLFMGGFRYLTSGGDPKATESAKGTLTHAIIGLVVLLLAFLFLKLISTIIGVDVTQFRVTLN